MGIKASFDTSGPVGAQPERWFKRWFKSVVPNPFALSLSKGSRREHQGFDKLSPNGGSIDVLHAKPDPSPG